MKKIKNGFTLIELMITMTIVAVLASVGIMAYQDYTIRAQVTEAFSLTDGIRISIDDYYIQNGFLPANLSVLGLIPIVGNYVSNVSMVNGTLTVSFGGVQASAAIPVTSQVIISPVINPGMNNIYWQCTQSGTMLKKYLPSSCF